MNSDLTRRPTDTALAGVPAPFAPDSKAAKRFIEYFAANIRNPNTRRAYTRAILGFSSWCETRDLNEIADIEPVHVAAYVELSGRRLAKPSVKQNQLTRMGAATQVERWIDETKELVAYRCNVADSVWWHCRSVSSNIGCGALGQALSISSSAPVRSGLARPSKLEQTETGCWRQSHQGAAAVHGLRDGAEWR
jgi:hypothetical protein